MIRWYEQKGYIIPKRKVQLYYINKYGVRKKNGVALRVKKGTKILIDISDLAPCSNAGVPVICPNCGKHFKVRWRTYSDRKSDKCNDCVKRTVIVGCHSYWVSKLITNNLDAKCDISKENDKRFLVLHHLRSRNKGGKNEKSNYVILSANYHMAFHNSLGGTSKGCTPKQYYKFKNKELIASQLDMLSDDWELYDYE